MTRLSVSLLAISMLGGCAASGSPDGIPLMQASWGEVRISSNNLGTLIWVPMQGGRTLRLPWMHSASRIDIRDGVDKSAVTALVRLKSTDCSSRSAVIMFDNSGAAAEMVGDCGASVRLSETDGEMVVVDDSTLAVMKVSGTELVQVRAPVKKAPPTPTPKPAASPTPVQAPTPPLVPTPPVPAPTPAPVPAPGVLPTVMPKPATPSAQPNSSVPTAIQPPGVPTIIPATPPIVRPASGAPAPLVLSPPASTKESTAPKPVPERH